MCESMREMDASCGNSHKPILSHTGGLSATFFGGKKCSRSRTLVTCEETSVSFAYTRIFFIFFQSDLYSNVLSYFILNCIAL